MKTVIVLMAQLPSYSSEVDSLKTLLKMQKTGSRGSQSRKKSRSFPALTNKIVKTRIVEGIPELTFPKFLKISSCNFRQWEKPLIRLKSYDDKY